MRAAAAVLAGLLLLPGLAACQRSDDADRLETSREFPRAMRAVSREADTDFPTEIQRESVNEAQTVMNTARIADGMTVADIGAGEGYYTVRLAERVGAKGRVLAQDIDRQALVRLGSRVERERLDNVSIKLGAPDDPRLPDASFDRIFLVHMYHQGTEPYAFLWRLRPALRTGGKVIVVEVDRPTGQNGIPPGLLFCEFGAVGFRLDQFVRKPELQGYYAQFEAVGERPAPGRIRPCDSAGKPVTK